MTSPITRQPRIVLADDHPIVLAGLGRLLRACCEVVASVSNGNEAVETVGRLRPDVLVVDLMMSDLDGLEVCRRVKQATPETDVVIITAFDDAGVQAVAFQTGASAFLAKHSITETLEGTIQRIFEDREDSPA